MYITYYSLNVLITLVDSSPLSLQIDFIPLITFFLTIPNQTISYSTSKLPFPFAFHTHQSDKGTLTQVPGVH